MAAYTKYDPRVDSLVVETRTNWAPDVLGLSDEDKQWLAKAIHADPKLAGKLSYERVHTGFIREITVTTADIERLYASRFGSEPASV
ncbi:hypothetical protein Pan44_05250 [Caulifigura coniformis]|uniref:Uncharacterized protein n=1 Tax=Caulifigura coniformis TaxID=2527983 RepID=A0A517S8S4_9PLAN|nr:hypothetical protein [Caulifigura coniformis]QDT52513.1 hypothetical protein Pan44_05250 [Caulifigura coniformis]